MAHLPNPHMKTAAGLLYLQQLEKDVAAAIASSTGLPLLDEPTAKPSAPQAAAKPMPAAPGQFADPLMERYASVGKTTGPSSSGKNDRPADPAR
jgi:hypothetical protein